MRERLKCEDRAREREKGERERGREGGREGEREREGGREKEREREGERGRGRKPLTSNAVSESRPKPTYAWLIVWIVLGALGANGNILQDKVGGGSTHVTE